MTYSIKKISDQVDGLDPRLPPFVVSDLGSFFGVCSRENGVTVTLDLLNAY